MQKYKQLTYEQRCQIYALNNRGKGQKDIAVLIGVRQSTISREQSVIQVKEAIDLNKRIALLQQGVLRK